jgi:hypothetical protein
MPLNTKHRLIPSLGINTYFALPGPHSPLQPLRRACQAHSVAFQGNF